MKARWLMWVLWPAFVGAAVAFVLVFSLIDPRELRVFGRPLELSSDAIYTIGFGVAWAVCALSSALTLCMLPASTLAPMSSPMSAADELE